MIQGPLPQSLSGEDEKEGEQQGRLRDLLHSGLWRQDCEAGKVVNCNDLLLTVNKRKKKYICLFASSDSTQHLWFVLWAQLSIGNKNLFDMTTIEIASPFVSRKVKVGFVSKNKNGFVGHPSTSVCHSLVASPIQICLDWTRLEASP